MTKHYLNIQESAIFTKRSISTIRRTLKKLTPSERAKVVKTQEVKGSGGERILIKKSWLSSFFMVSSENVEKQEPEVESSMPSHAYSLEEARKKEIELLKGRAEEKEEQVKQLYRQLETKDKQIEKTQEQNSSLLERIKESNFLLASLRQEVGQLRELGSMPVLKDKQEEELEPEGVEEPKQKTEGGDPTEEKSPSSMILLYFLFGIVLILFLLLFILSESGYF